MTDQKQAPERDSVKWWIEDRAPVDVAEAFEALAKQRDELSAKVERLSVYRHRSGVADDKLERLSAMNSILERKLNQALASVGAVIEKAASLVPKEHMLTGHMIRSIADIQNAIRAINPDATAALNEMLADAWDEGQDTYREWPLEKNPYRKDAT